MRNSNLEEQLSAARSIASSLQTWAQGALKGGKPTLLLLPRNAPAILALCEQFIRLDQADEKRKARAGRPRTDNPKSTTLRSRKHRENKRKTKGRNT